jgi:hypothetical protein
VGGDGGNTRGKTERKRYKGKGQVEVVKWEERCGMKEVETENVEVAV